MATKTFFYPVKIGVSVESKKARKGVDEIEKDLTRMQKRALAAVDSVQKAIDAFGKLKSKVFTDNSARDGGSNRTWTREHQNIYKATQLMNRYEVSISKLKGNQTELQKLNQTLADPRVARNIDDRTKAILREKAAMIDSIKAAKDLEKQNARILAQKTRTAQKRAENMQTVGGGIQSAGVTATAIATAPIVAGFYAAIKVGAEYEASMNMLQAVTGATAEEMKRADEIAIKLGNDITLPGVSAKDAAEAMTELGKAGFTVADAMDAAQGTLRLARAAGIGAAQAAQIQANALNMFNLAASDATRVADLLAGAANASSAEITDIAQSLQQAGAVFSAANVPIEDTVALIATLANNSIIGSDAGTSLKTMMQRLQSPTDNAAAALKALNIQVYDQQGKMKPMRDIIGQFENSLQGLNQQQRDQAINTIFGSDAMRAALIIFGKGVKGFDEIKESVMRANAAQELAAARSKGLAGAWDALRSQAETIGLVVYNRIKQPLTELVIFAATGLSKLTDWFMNLSEPVQQIILVFGGLVAAFGPLLTIVGTVVIALGSLSAALTALGGLASVASVIGVVAAALAGLAVGFTPLIAWITIFYTAWTKNFAGLRDFTAKVWEAVKTGTENALGKLLATVNRIGGQIIGWWQDNYLLIERVVLKVHDGISSAVALVLGVIFGFWQSHGSKIIAAVNFIWGTIEKVVSAALDILGSIIRTALLLLDGEWDQGWNNVLSTLQKISVLIVSAARTMSTLILAAIADLAKKLYANSGEIYEKIGQITAVGIKYIVGLIANLPLILIKLVPKFISAGMQIGQAIWQGLKDGITGQGNSPDAVNFDLASLFDASPAEKAAKGVENLADAFDKLGKKTVENTEKTTKFNKELADVGENTKKARRATENSRIDNLLPNRGAGFNSYRSPSAKFGTEKTIDNLERLGQIWSQISNKPFQVGDMAKRGGGSLPGHKAHKDGNQADIRPFRLDGKNLPTNIGDSSYDRATTRKFIETLKNVIPGAVVLFNDPQLIKEGLTKYAAGHDNHLHVNRLGGKFSAKKSGDLSSATDLDQYNQSLSDSLTKVERERVLRTSIDTYRKLGILPDDDMIRNFNQLLVEDARKAGKLQPTLEETKKLFAGLSPLSGVQDGEISARPLNRRDQRILDAADNLKLTERQKELDERRLYIADEIGAKSLDYNLSLQEALTDTEVEYGLLQRRNVAIETSVEFEKQRNDQIRAIGDVERDLGVLRAQNANVEFVSQRRLLDAKRDQLALEQDITILQDKIANVGENSALRYQRAWLDAVREVKEANIEAVESQIRSQVKLESSMVRSNDQIRAKVLDHLASQKTLNESIADGIVNVYEKAATGIEKLLDKAGIGKIPVLGDIAKANARSFLTKITTGLLDKFLPSEVLDKINSTGNPLLDQSLKQTDLLKEIRDAVTFKGVSGITSGGGSGGSLSGGGWFGIIKNLLGGGGGGQQGFPNAVNFANNPSGLSANPNKLRAIWDVPGSGLNQSGGGGGLLGNLKNIFSNKEGGIFAPKKTVFGGQSKLAGMMSGIGSLASLAGGLIGGKVGGILSGAGTGAQIGAMFGPWGAGIGAAAGALIGLFSGDPKRKADKKQNLPALQKGFSDALTALRALAANKKALFDDPDGVIAQANELKAQIASGFGIEFQSKKYKKVAQQQIAQKVAEAEALVKQIESEAALQRNKRAKMESYAPTFADGGHVSRFSEKSFQNNPLGYITGPGTNRSDSILARISNGEYVLDAQTVKNLGIRRLDALRMTKGRGADRIFRSMNAQTIGFAEGGVVGLSQPSANQTQSFQRGNITVNTNVYPNEGGARVETEIYEDDRLLERKIENIIYRNGQDGKIYKAMKNVEKGRN